jgi:hypothetical protein
MIASILSLVLPLSSSGADVSVKVELAPGITIAYHNDAWYREREDERRREQARIEADRERDRHDHELWEHRKPGDRWSDGPWHDRQDEWEVRRAERMRQEHEREDARLARLRFLEAEEARDREERRVALEHRLMDERRDEERRRSFEDRDRGPVRPDAKVHDDDRYEHGGRGISD